ncbi:adhesion G-protein coupled receptor methuselah-like 1 isoform X2 [Rhynchophorus ferrugineus]|uniref:adhesion G-protein coupled receptor methuselah-like 1 isoform X2 n=1 Tax=Rhynchophorus ferrugineus TaxID=354439 RepID=UPI003FCD4E1C
MTPLQKLVILELICLAFGHVKTVKRNVTIGKCCALDEILTYEQKCIKSYNSSWDLKVYSNGSFVSFAGKLPPRWVVKEHLRPRCAKPVVEALENRRFVPSITGTAMIVEYDQKITPSQYCIDYNYVLFCPNNYSPEGYTSVLVKKCCGENAVYSEQNSTCVHFKNSSYNIDVGPNKTLGFGFPICGGSSFTVAGKLNQAHLLDNGSVLINSSSVTLPAGNFCLEFMKEQLDEPASVITCRDYLPRIVTASVADNESIKFTIYPIGLAISAIFLAATLAAGSLLPASHHVLHWRCQTNYVTCLLIGDVLLCITQVVGATLTYTPCFTIAVFMHFFFLAAFFWLNTMCFNIWWTFRDLRPQSTEKSQERIRFYLYQAYAWGVPFVIAFVGAVADLTRYEGILRPSFAENKCWFKDNTEIFSYFFGPLGTLLVVNLVLFILTARELTCGLWKRELVKSTTERAALGRICLKLVIVMGVTWIADVLSWAVGGPQWLWYITDIFNCLQGVFIFIVVGCQPQRRHIQNPTDPLALLDLNPGFGNSRYYQL